jgi:hypothetical protein
MLTMIRHVHDRQHAPDLLHLHGLLPLQDTRHGRTCPAKDFRSLRDPRHLEPSHPSQDHLHINKHAYISAWYLESQRYGTVTDDEIRLACLGRRTVMVGESSTQGMAVKKYIIASKGLGIGLYLAPIISNFLLSLFPFYQRSLILYSSCYLYHLIPHLCSLLDLFSSRPPSSRNRIRIAPPNISSACPYPSKDTPSSVGI